ncbi:MAG: hypothetical protein COA82_04315 [Alkaliphilus sp.]|nr:hypothetical protein [bacterium AH-315-G05]MBN4074513.1 hypothetical protein [bacterium AH-315-E09]PHS35472.1 MAG: hypothetical protein COA82_04315 [Alkaliphilus sp.]
MRKEKIVFVFIVLLFLIVSSVYAVSAKNLINWADTPSSSDTSLSQSPDSVDIGNPNTAMNAGSTDVVLKPENGNIEVVILNGYTGYQSYIEASIVNITNMAVRITDAEIVAGSVAPVNSFDFIEIAFVD